MATPAVLIPTLAPSAPLTMTSIEISHLVERRHDNVKRTIARIAEQGVIVEPQIEDVPFVDDSGRQRTTRAYRFCGERGKRDSIVVVAQLCPEFTGRLVDRWQALESGDAVPAFQLEPQNVNAVKVRQKPAPLTPAPLTKTVDLARYAELLECENAHLRQRITPAPVVSRRPMTPTPRLRPLTDAERAEAVRLLNAGLSAYAVAKQIGCSRRTIGRILNRATSAAEVHHA